MLSTSGESLCLDWLKERRGAPADTLYELGFGWRSGLSGIGSGVVVIHLGRSVTQVREQEARLLLLRVVFSAFLKISAETLTAKRLSHETIHGLRATSSHQT